MHDIRLIRETPHAFDAGLARRGLAPLADEILALDETRRGPIAAAETALAERNAASREVGAAKARGDEAEFERLRALVAERRTRSPGSRPRPPQADAALRDLLLGIPNLPIDDVPDGPDETANVELRRWGSPRNFAFDAAASTTRSPPPAPASTSRPRPGSPARRFVVMKGAMVRAAPGARPVHARHPRRAARPDRGLDPGAGPRRGDVSAPASCRSSPRTATRPPTAGG